MKIGYDAKRLFRNQTGLGNYSRTLVKNYGEAYHTDPISLFTKSAKSSDITQEFISSRYELIQPQGRALAWHQFGISRSIKSAKVDIFHGLSHELPYGIGKSGARSVVTMHDVCYLTFPSMFPAIERAIYSVKYKHACKSADMIIAISHSTKSDLQEYFGVEEKRVRVLYQAINSQFYEEMTSEYARNIVRGYGIESDYMLYVGSINSRKNLMGLIRAMSLMDSNSKLPLVVIGTGGKYKDECLKEAERLGVRSDIVLMEGVRSMESLQAFYTTAKLMVYPSFYEGFGLPVTEAILSRCPVITSNVSSLPEAGGSAAKYVDPYSAEELSVAISQVLEMGDAKRQELVERGRIEALQKFNPQSLTTSLHNIYKEIV